MLSATSTHAPAPAWCPPATALRSSRSAFASGGSAPLRASPRVCLAGAVKSVSSVGITAQLSSSSSVRLDIQGRHLEVTPAIREYAQTKIGHALSHFDGTAGTHQALVRLSARSRERQHGAPLQKAEVTITTKRGVVRAECEEQTLYAAVDKAADKLERQLRKIKERDVKGGVHTHHQTDGQARIGAHLPEEVPVLDTSREADLAHLPAEVIRRKVFSVDAMTVEEAVEKLEDVGHAFFLFRDSKSPGEIQVLYRRNAGGYGILVPRGQ